MKASRIRSALTLVVGAVISVLGLSACATAATKQAVPARLTVSHFPNISNIPHWTWATEQVKEGGQNRYFVIARPAKVTTDHLPILVVLHGRQMTPEMIAGISGFLRMVGQAVVVYPAGIGRSWNAGYCCGVAHSEEVNDVSFLEAVIHDVLTTVRSTSATSVFLAGYSNGGRMAYRLACADSGAFAGVAAVEAVPVYTCGGVKPVPLIVVASTGDPLITIGSDEPAKSISGHVEPRVQQVVAEWRILDHCGADVSLQRVGSASVDEWSRCARGSRVEFVEYAGGSHRWPEGDASTPSAQQLIWSFFTHQRPAPERPASIRRGGTRCGTLCP